MGALSNIDVAVPGVQRIGSREFTGLRLLIVGGLP